MSTRPKLTVIIPTCGRPSLRAAISSALAQHENVEVIVVDASGEHAARKWLDARASLEYVVSETQLKPGAARWTGAQRSTGDWVSFLDDDDAYAPDRFARLEESAGDADLASSGFFEVPYEVTVAASVGDWADGWQSIMRSGVAVEQRIEHPKAGDDIVGYLFKRDRIRLRRRIVTSSLLVRGDIARESPWNANLTRFEDWQWLTRQTMQGARWHHLPEPLVAISTRSSGSLTARTDIRIDESVVWAIELLGGRRRRELGDLIACDVAVTLAQSGDARAALDAWRLARTAGRPGKKAEIRLIAELTKQLITNPASFRSQT